MVGSNSNLNLRDWQSYYIKLDPSYGNLIASILQSLYKNKYSTINSLINTIKRKQSKIVTEEGTIDLLLKFSEVIVLTPRFQVINTEAESGNKIIRTLSISCDFVITLNFNNIKGFGRDYITSVDEILLKVNAANRKILIKYLLKQIIHGNYFVSMDFLEKEIFEAKIPYTEYTVNYIFDRFHVKEYNTMFSLVTANNYDDNNALLTNIKVLSIPFTPYHADTYLTRDLQNIYRLKYNIGKSELNTKLIYLNAEYFVNESRTVYDMLVLGIYTNFLPNRTDRNCEEDFHFKMDDMKNDEPCKPDSETGEDKMEFVDKFERKNTILKILRTDKIPRHEVDFLDTLDYEKLHIKNAFVTILNYLANPFLSKVIDTAQMRFLKQYIITNYGTNIKENVDDETRALIEKKFGDFIHSQKCFFIEFYNTVIDDICESTGEKKYLVDMIVRTSSLFRNFCFIRYLAKPKKSSFENFRMFLKTIGSDFFGFFNDGAETDMVVIPYVKFKEFLVYLATAEINSSWQKLKDLCEDLLKSVNSLVFSASLSGAEARMVIIDNNDFNITVKDRNNTKNFQIKTFEDIEFIFQEKEQEKFKALVKMLFNLHQKTGFGFDNKKDFNKILELYNSRCGEYNLNKLKLDQYEEMTSGSRGLIAFLKKLIFWIPMALSNRNLYKVMKKNDEMEKKVRYYYSQAGDQRKTTVFASGNTELGKMKDKIMDFVGENEDRELQVLRNHLKENRNKPGQEQPKKTERRDETPKITLPQLDDDEEKLFEFINKYLKEDKDILFTRSSNRDEEIIVLYAKNGKSLLSINGTGGDLNTLDEHSTRYYNIKNLIAKRYISQKELVRTTEDSKKICYLTFARQYYQYINKYR